MPETIPIDMPAKPAGVEATLTAEPTPTPPPATTPMQALFERAAGREGAAPTPAAPEATPSVSATPEAAPAATPPPTEDFVPPSVLLGEEPTPTATTPSVADLMPEEPPVVIRTEKGKADYKKWREHQISLEKQLTEATGKLKNQAPADDGLRAENEQYKARLQEMSQAFEKFGIEFHPAFRSQFTVPRDAMVDQARQLLKDVGLEGNLLDRAVVSAGKEHFEAMDELGDGIKSESARIKMFDLVDKIRQKNGEIEAAKGDAKTRQQQWELQARAEQHRQAEAQIKQCNLMIDAATEHLRDKAGFDLFKKIPGNDKWNAVVDQMRSEMGELMTNTQDPMQIAGATSLAVACPRYKAWCDSLLKQNKALQVELAEYKQSTPGLGGNGAGAGAGNGAPAEDESGIKGLFKRELAASRSVFGS